MVVFQELVLGSAAVVQRPVLDGVPVVRSEYLVLEAVSQKLVPDDDVSYLMIQLC